MAYISQEQKKEKLKKLKPLFKKYKVRATVSIRNYSTLSLNIWESPYDFMGQHFEYKKKNPGLFSNLTKENYEEIYLGARSIDFKEFQGNAKKFLIEANAVLQESNYDKSDSMTDYFDIGFYVKINIGNSEKPYIFNPELAEKKLEPTKIITSKNIKVVDYSEKALAIFGDTREVKEDLKAMGARFNRLDRKSVV